MNRKPGFSELISLYERELFESVLPFWLNHSIDQTNGGYFSCLDRNGSVYDTDKFIWLQARQVWLFSMLYNRERNEANWLQVSADGATFLRDHGTDDNGHWYFSVTQQGKPLIAPYNIFSDCFAAMAFSQYALAVGDEQAKQLARETFQNILKRQHNPKGKFSKAVEGTRPLKMMALPMILANLSLELEWMLSETEVQEAVNNCTDVLFSDFLDGDKGILREFVAPDGEYSDSFEGRLINPGHGIEAMWFVMDIAERFGDNSLVDQAVDATLRTLEFGWDKDYGGIFYFLDIEGHPPQQLEWDQKLWWVHLETLVALLMGYRLSGNEECLDWFYRVHEYAWKHFPDSKHGEWFGYLNRRGEVLLPLKGGKWKGCFHVPRALFMCRNELRKLVSGGGSA